MYLNPKPYQLGNAAAAMNSLVGDSICSTKLNLPYTHNQPLHPAAALKTLVGDSICMEDHGNTVFCCAFSPGPIEGPEGGNIDLGM